MRITTNFKQCIVCLNNTVGDWEHIIPQSIGGRLEANLICNGCNHKFGSDLVSQLNSDPAIRYAYEHLKEQLPSLYNTAQGKATFVGKAKDGSVVRISNGNGKPKVLPGQGVNKSLILDTNDARQALVKKMRRAKLSISQISEYESHFVQLGENEQLHIPSGEIFIKRSIPSLFPEVGESKLNDRLFVLITYEYLSLLIGNKIFSDYFDPIRCYILDGTTTKQLTIKRLRGEMYSPYHVLDLDLMPNSTTIRVRFFRWVIFDVTFHGLVYAGPDTVYLEDLETGQSLIAPTKADARQGHYYLHI